MYERAVEDVRAGNDGARVFYAQLTLIGTFPANHQTDPLELGPKTT